MFKSLRWQLTIRYVWLSALVYLIFGFISIGIFRTSLTAALDHELQALSVEACHDIDLRGNAPHIVDWENIVEAEPRISFVVFELFDMKGNLVEERGSKRKVNMLSDKTESFVGPQDMRVMVSPLFVNNKKVGYMQILHNTTYRDTAAWDFAFTLAVITPFLLLGLGFAGYIYSGSAIKPIENSFLILRQFMSDAGHELATPVSIIKANVESLEAELKEEKALNESSASRLQVLLRAADRMGYLVHDLSFLSKTENPNLKPAKEVVTLEKIVGPIVEEFSELFKEKNIELSYACKSWQPMAIVGNADSLKRMMTNLLQNALRYTDAGGKVIVSLTSEGNNAVLTVADTGIGIPEESLPHVFERFFRVEQSRSRASGGSGLGLAIVRAIAEAHNGQVTVKSKVGKGTQFTILLPLKT
jgi:signal transduction histidine kinase